MASRTPEGKHVARFIILKKNATDEKFIRAYGLPGFYATREEAQKALDAYTVKFSDVQFKIRQK